MLLLSTTTHTIQWPLRSLYHKPNEELEQTEPVVLLIYTHIMALADSSKGCEINKNHLNSILCVY